MSTVTSLTEEQRLNYINTQDDVTIVGTAKTDVIGNSGSNVSIEGGAGNDNLVNGKSKNKSDSPGDDVTISGGDGNDTVNNGGDRASIDGGAGNDLLINGKNGGSGDNTTIRGGKGSDTISNNGGENVSIYGEEDDDNIFNNGNQAFIDGGAGNDFITNGNAYSHTTEGGTINGGAGNDTIDSYSSDASIDGGAGADSILSNGDYVTINGGAGADYIRSKGNYALLDGGDGNDTVIVEGYGATVYGDAGDDYIKSRGDTSIYGGEGNDTIVVNAGSDDSGLISANEGNDSIFVSKGNEFTISGGDGADTIAVFSSDSSVNGGAGNDYIRVGGTGNTVNGGAGNDSIEVASRTNSQNIIKYKAGDGDDTIHVISSGGLNGGEVTIRLMDDSTLGEPSVSLNGDIIINVGNSKLTFKEAHGEKIIFIDADDNEISVINGEGREYVETSSTDFTVSELNNVRGYQINNTIESAKVTASNANDAIESNADKVTINAGTGHDYIESNGDNVSINGGAGSDTIESHGDKATILGGDGNDIINNQGNNSTLSGGAGDNDIVNYGKNVSITAGAGDDGIFNYAVGEVLNEETDEYETIQPDNVTINAGDGNNEIQNQGSKVLITAGKGDDTIVSYPNGGQGYSVDNVTINAGDGNNSITSNGSNVSITAGTGDDTIGSYSYNVEDGYFTENVTINAGNGDNSITSGGSKVSITAGTGNDTIVNNQNNYLISSSYDEENDEIVHAEDVKINAGDGNNHVTNYGRKTTITAGKGDDVILNLHNEGNFSYDEDGNEIFFLPDSVSIGAGDGDNYIENQGRNVSITAGKGNDTIYNTYNDSAYIYNSETAQYEYNYPDNVSIAAGDGDNDIVNFGSNVSITAGSGSDSIFNGVLDYSTSEIVNTKDVTINVGTGDNFVVNFGSNVLITAGDGKDSIFNGVDYEYDGYYNNWYRYQENSTIDAGDGDNYIRSRSGNTKITAGKGNDSIFNDLGTYPYQDEETSTEETRFIENTTINAGDGNNYIENYNRKTSITAGAGNDTIINVHNSEYTFWNEEKEDDEFAYPDDVLINAGNGDNYIENSGKNVSITTGTGNDTISLSSSATGNVINYKSGNDVIYGFNETSTLLVSGGAFSSVEIGDDVILTIDDKNISLVGAAGLSALNVDFTLVEGTWSVSGGKATFTSDGKTLVTVSGLSSDANADDLTINNGTVTVAKNALGTTNVSVSGGDYKLALGSDVTAEAATTDWSIKSGKAVYQQTTPAHYNLATNEKSIIYSKAATETLTTVSGLNSSVKAEDLTLSDGTITLAKNALGTTNVSISGGDYKLALGSDVTAESTTTDWNVSKGKAIYQQTTSAHYDLAKNEKSIIYSKAATETLTTVSGLNSSVKAEDLTLSDGTITLAKNALGTTNVSISGGDYKLALGSDVTAEAATTDWSIKSGKAAYQQTTPAHYNLATNEKSIIYSKAATETLTTVSGLNSSVKAGDLTLSDGTITLAKNALGTTNVSISGGDYKLALGSDVTAEAATTDWSIKSGKAVYQQTTPAHYNLATNEKSIIYSKAATETLTTVSGLNSSVKAEDLTLSDGTITLAKNALGTTNVSVSGGDYKLALGSDVTAESTTTDWNVSKGKAIYQQTTSAHYDLAKNEKSIIYSKAATETLTTVSGLNSSVKAGDLTLSDGTITLAKNALGTTNVLVSGGNYKLALGSDVTAEAATTDWSIKSGKAVYQQTTPAHYNLATNEKSIIYSKAATETLTTVSGLNSSVKAEDLTLSDGTITLAKNALGTTNVSVSGGDYKLALGSDVTAESTTTDWNVSKGKAIYQQTTSAHYDLAKNEKSITYSKAATANLVTVSGLSTGATKDDLTIDGKTITVAKNALGTSKVSVSGDYKLALGSDVTAEQATTDWNVSKGKAIYQQTTPAHYDLTNDKTITYSKTATANLVTVSGLSTGATKADISLGEDGKTITVTKNALGTSKVSLTDKSNTYKLALGSDVTAEQATTDWNVSKGKAIYQQTTPAHYDLTNDKTITYSKTATANLVTVSGLSTGATKADISLGEDGKTITVAKNALGTSKVSLTDKSNTYKLALGEGIATSGKVTADWSVKGTTATYKGDVTPYYTLTNDKTITYTKEKKNATLATITNLRNGATESDITINGTTITLAANALTTDVKKKTTVKGDYTLAIDDSLKSAKEKNIWTVDKTTATYSFGKTGYYTLATDNNKSVTYTAATKGATSLITLTNLNSKNITPTAEGTIDGIKLDESTKTVTLGADVLNKKTVELKGDYKLALDEDDDKIEISEVQDAKWAHKGTTDTLSQKTTKGYSLDSDKKITYASKDTSATLATVRGTVKALADSGYDATTDTVTLSKSDLSSKVTISGTTKFNFTSGDYGKASITGSNAADTITIGGSNVSINAGKGNDSITVTGSNVSINAGAGDDYVDMGNGSNLFIYTAGEGNDTLTNFGTNDTISVASNATATQSDKDGNLLVTIKSGSKSGTLTLLGQAGKKIVQEGTTVKISDSTKSGDVENADVVSTGVAISADKISDNYFDASPQLNEILGASYDAISTDEFGTSYDATQLTKQTVVYGAKK